MAPSRNAYRPHDLARDNCRAVPAVPGADVRAADVRRMARDAVAHEERDDQARRTRIREGPGFVFSGLCQRRYLWRQGEGWYAMAEPAKRRARHGDSLEKSVEEILAAARPLRLDEMIIEDLTEEEARAFYEAIDNL
jgi:hypothetical protein